jgi:uncharacterized membrane protein
MNETSLTQAMTIISVLLAGFVLALFVICVAEAMYHKHEIAKLAKENSVCPQDSKPRQNSNSLI